MNHPPPPLPRDQRAVDREHLKLLSIFHFVVAGLAFAGLGFLVLHFMIFRTFLNNPEMWEKASSPPPAEFFAIFKWFYLLMGLMMVLAAIGNLMSGFYIRARKHRIFSLVIAALNCIQVPFGTVLGVFTIIVLARESVEASYASASTPTAE